MRRFFALNLDAFGELFVESKIMSITSINVTFGSLALAVMMDIWKRVLPKSIAIGGNKDEQKEI